MIQRLLMRLVCDTCVHIYVCVYDVCIYVYVCTFIATCKINRISTVFNGWFVPVYYWDSVGAIPIYFASRSMYVYMHTVTYNEACFRCILCLWVNTYTQHTYHFSLFLALYVSCGVHECGCRFACLVTYVLWHMSCDICIIWTRVTWTLLHGFACLVTCISYSERLLIAEMKGLVTPCMYTHMLYAGPHRSLLWGLARMKAPALWTRSLYWWVSIFCLFVPSYYLWVSSRYSVSLCLGAYARFLILIYLQQRHCKHQMLCTSRCWNNF